MEFTSMVGFAAGIITSASFIPQVIKGYKTKKLDDVSFGMYFVLVVGMSLWFYYGVLLNEIPIIAANLFSMICGVFVLLLKYIYGKRNR